MTKTLNIRVFNIEWDTDGDKRILASLPREVEMELEFDEEDRGYLDAFIADQLTDDYRCSASFDYEIIK